MIRTLPVSCAILVCCCMMNAATVRSLRFTGNHGITGRRLEEAMNTKPRSFFSPSGLRLDLESLLQLYHQQGFYFAEIGIDSLSFSKDSSVVDVSLRIDEGDQSEVGELHLEGNTVFTVEEILQRFDTHTGKPLDRQILERDIDALISRYERIGYPFAKVEIVNIAQVDSGRNHVLRIEITVDEGSKVHINEIRVEGNTETNEHVITREARVTPGELFDEDKLAKIRQRLNRLNIFSLVHDPQLYMNSTGGGLLLVVQEGATNTFDGIVGYAPGSSSGEGMFTGLVNVSMRNLFGTARKLHVSWQKDESRSQEVALQYVEPWIFDIPLNLSGEFYQRQQDSTYVRRAVEAKADILLTESFSVGGVFNHENIIPSSTTAIQNVANSRTITTGIEIQYDSRDDILSPTNGVNYRSEYTIGNKKIFTPSRQDETHSVQKVSLDTDLFIEPVSRQVVAVGLHGRQLTSDRIEIGDLYRFGGTTTLRGYRENQFLGSRIAWTNTEYRFLLSRHSFFYGFFDTGYYYLPGDSANGSSSLQHFKYGYGVGVRLETSLGNIGVSLALGKGDSFSQAKIHVGLINDF